MVLFYDIRIILQLQVKMQLLVVHIPQTSYILLCKTTVKLIYPFPVLNNAEEISKLLNNQITLFI